MNSYKQESKELTVIVRAKDLCKYIMTVTQKSPKQYRFTFTTRLQNLAMDIIQEIYFANEMYVGGTYEKQNLMARQRYQQSAMTNTRMLAYFAQLALEEKAILPKQYEQIAIMTTDVLNMLGAWMRSDRKQFGIN